MEIKASTFFTEEQQEQISAAIKEAEESTSGEIRVHIETSLTGNVLDRAAWIFKKIGMHSTDQHNGVLFYLAITNRQFAIIGDTGINTRVPTDFWDKIKDLLQIHFSKGEHTEGLVQGIMLAGEQLKEHFPHMKGDINELPNDISFEDPV